MTPKVPKIGPVRSTAFLLLMLCLQPSLALAGSAKQVSSCETTTNFKTIQTDCTVLQSRVTPVKKCTEIGSYDKVKCHWVRQPVTSRIGKLRKRSRNPYVTRALKHKVE